MFEENCPRFESLSLSAPLVFYMPLIFAFKAGKLKIISATFVLYDRIRGSESILIDFHLKVFIF